MKFSLTLNYVSTITSTNYHTLHYLDTLPTVAPIMTYAL